MRFNCFSWFVSGFDDQLTTAHKNRDRFKVIEFHCMIHFNCFFVVEMTTGFLVSNHESFFYGLELFEKKKKNTLAFNYDETLDPLSKFSTTVFKS